MPKSLPALIKILLRLLLLAAFLVPAAFLIAREENNYIEEEEFEEYVPAVPPRWYRSNSSGMTLEFIPSRLVAMRNEYSLSVEIVHRDELPEILLPYHDDSHTIELRTLFRADNEPRRQWIFRDSRDLAMVVASGSACFFGGESSEEEGPTGFIEIMNSDGAVVIERVFEEDLSQWEFRFFYDRNILISAETWFKRAPVPPAALYSAGYYSYEYPDMAYNDTAYNAEQPVVSPPAFVLLHTDFYRYSRSGALRAIDRIFHGELEEELDRLVFPRIAPLISPAREPGALPVFYIPEFILGAMNIEGARVSYTIDNRGRILSEVWRDEYDNILGEFLNTWYGDRLKSVLWRTDYDERLVEYEYDDNGNRIVERNFRRGVLERSVASLDGIDIEDIFMNGRLVLRAIWEDGLKISEERISYAVTRGSQ